MLGFKPFGALESWVMRSAILMATMAFTLGACSLLTSLDGLSEPTAAVPVEAGSDTATGPSGDASATVDGPADAATEAHFDCNAAGLVAFYGFDEGAGGLVHDCSPRHLDGTFDPSAGNTAWGMRRGGGAITFAGDGGRVTVPWGTELDMPGAFTVAGFFRVDAPPSSYVSLAWHHFQGRGWEITFAQGAAYAQVGLVSGELLRLPFPRFAMSTWRHLAAVYEPGVRLEIYLDGTSAAKLTTVDGGALPNVPASSVNADLGIGSVFDGTSWSGGADDLAIFARALSDAELAALAAR